LVAAPPAPRWSYGLPGRGSPSSSNGYVYIANHSSLFDIPVVLATLPDNIRIMYKKELEKIPVFGLALKMSPFIAVVRERSREASGTLDAVVETMSKGSSVLVFPEGTRSDDGMPGPFRRGAIAIAVRSGTAIVPVVIEGTSRILPNGSSHLRSGKATLTIHEPVRVPGALDRVQEQALVHNLRSIFVEQLSLHHDT
jgi:1-acyl-sn-glycerol-3-phosphate acyltransferase